MTAVYLGEVVCFKRAPLFESYLAEVAARLRTARKTVVRSTLAEVMSKQERQLVETSAPRKPRRSRPTTARRCCGCAGGRITSAPSSTSTTSARWPCSPATARATSACRRKCRRTPSARWRPKRPSSASDRGSGVRPRRPRALRALLSRARAWPHQGQLPVRLQRGSRRHDVAHAGGQAVPHRQRHPDHVARLSQSRRRACRIAGHGSHALPPVAAELRHGGTWRRSSATRSMARSTPPKPARSSTPCKLGAPFSNGFYRGARGHSWTARQIDINSDRVC